MIIVAGEIVMNPERVELALERAQRMIAATRAEPGCISYEYFSALDDPGRYLIFERWESQAAIDAHNAAPHTVEFMGGLGDFDLSSVEVNAYEVADAVRVL